MSTSTTPKELLARGILTPEELDRLCEESKATEYLVDDFLPRVGVGIAGGDSSIGKSPWLYQLGLCVASGLPFAGHELKQATVLYYDLENTTHDSQKMRDAILRFLGLSEKPPGWLVRFDPPDGISGLESDIEKAKPGLVLVDTLREFSPNATENNHQAAKLLKSERALSRRFDCFILQSHHIRKPKEEKPGAPSTRKKLVGDTSVVAWLLEMEGPRALVNQSDVRITLEEGNGAPAALNVKWNRRVHGDSPLILFERVFDSDGDPIGYQHLTGADRLTPERRAAFDKLPDAPTEFSFSDAKAALARSDDPTAKFLDACKQLRLVEKLGRGRYRKVPTSPSVAADDDAGPTTKPTEEMPGREGVEYIEERSK